MKRIPLPFIAYVLFICSVYSQQNIFAGADERTPSLSQYFSWINNTNEGSTETQTLINLDFFKWLKDEYGMTLDIYVVSAGAIDKARWYGSMDSDEFNMQFPNGFDTIYHRAKRIGTRLGTWGGPDGFGDTPEEEKARIEMIVRLCKDYEFRLLKFDAVVGQLRDEKQDAFIRMMTECRKYSPDLILLNHRLNLSKDAKKHATTSLWGGDETYIDVHMTNSITAPHHRAEALSRSLVPDLKRLTEDHGVCISSSLDYWEDDLILQAFNRGLILAPQIYGNPWLLRDDEFPRLARIFNLHRKYRDILVDGMVLPESYGPHAVSRGNSNTRFITLRNLSWNADSYSIRLDEEIGIASDKKITLVQLHPTEKVLGTFSKGDQVSVAVMPFRACMLMATAEEIGESLILGADFQVLKNLKGQPIEIDVLGMPGTQTNISLLNANEYKSATINGRSASKLLEGASVLISFPGELLSKSLHRKLGTFTTCPIPADAEALYEATVFASDNNALEVRSLFRSGPTTIPQVQAARDALFNQTTFVNRGVWDKNLFDGNLATGFWPTTAYNTARPSFRLDLGEVQHVDELLVTIPDVFSLAPLKEEEGNRVEISTDLINWETITYLARTNMRIAIGKPVRYLRFKYFARQIAEIEAKSSGKKLDRNLWRATNLFPHPSRKKVVKTWKSTVALDEIADNSYLCVAINGTHGPEGVYAAAKINGKLIGAPDRAPAHLTNPWEAFNHRANKNYTYYIPLKKEYTGKMMEIFVLGCNPENMDIHPELWISAYPHPWEKIKLVLEK